MDSSNIAFTLVHNSSSFLFNSYFPHHVPKEDELDFLWSFVAELTCFGFGGLALLLLLVTLVLSTKGLLDDALVCTGVFA